MNRQEILYALILAGVAGYAVYALTRKKKEEAPSGESVLVDVASGAAGGMVGDLWTWLFNSDEPAGSEESEGGF